MILKLLMDNIKFRINKFDVKLFIAELTKLSSSTIAHKIKMNNLFVRKLKIGTKSTSVVNLLQY